MSNLMQTTPDTGREGDLLRFFVLTFILTWVLHGAIALIEFDNLFEAGLPLLLYMLGLLGPMAAALILSRRPGGTGARALLARIGYVRFGLGWYVMALGMVAGANHLAILLNMGLGGPGPESWFALPLGLLPVLALVQIWVVFGEETGWRGYALPRLQERCGSLGASLILGLVWTIWHLPMFLMPGAPQYGSSPFLFAGFIISWSVLSALLYNRTGGSLMAVMLFHWATNMWAFALPIPEGAQTYSLAFIVLAACLAAVALPRPLFKFAAD